MTQKPLGGDWPFEDLENTAVFTTQSILDGKAWIAMVHHDAADGAWQFLPEDGALMSDAAVAGLKTLYVLDPSIANLADLPLGWQAWRVSSESAWVRQPVIGC